MSTPGGDYLVFRPLSKHLLDRCLSSGPGFSQRNRYQSIVGHMPLLRGIRSWSRRTVAVGGPLVSAAQVVPACSTIGMTHFCSNSKAWLSVRSALGSLGIGSKALGSGLPFLGIRRLSVNPRLVLPRRTVSPLNPTLLSLAALPNQAEVEELCLLLHLGGGTTTRL